MGVRHLSSSEPIRYWRPHGAESASQDVIRRHRQARRRPSVEQIGERDTPTGDQVEIGTDDEDERVPCFGDLSVSLTPAE